jgi:predicted nucleic acid-binding Zn finger protein
MQQLEIAKKSTSKYQKTEQVNESINKRREASGQTLALTREVFRITNSDTFYCESEKVKDQYYFIRYESCFQYCSCLDNSFRGIKCKHIWGIEAAIRKGTLVDIEKLPKGVQRFPQKITAKSYEEDDYDF